MAEFEGPGSESLFLDWNLLDDRIVWQGPVETWTGLPMTRIASGSSLAALLGSGGAERSAAIHDAASGFFDVRYEVSTPRARFLVEETGTCVHAPDGRIAVVRSRLRRRTGRLSDPQSAHLTDGLMTRQSLYLVLADLLAAGGACGLLHLELGESDRGRQRALLGSVCGMLRHGDAAAPFNDSSVLALLRGADHQQIAVAAQNIQTQWTVSGGAALSASAVAGPKFGKTPALLLHRLFTTRDIVRARSVSGLVCYTEQLVSRDVGLRRVALGDELVAALNGRTITLTPRALRDGRGETIGLDLVAEAGFDAGPAELAPLRPLYGRLDVAEALDHRVAELGLARAIASATPVCIFLSAATAAPGWLDLIEAVARRQGGGAGPLVIDLPVHDALSSVQEIREIAGRLRDAGCGLSLSGLRAVDDCPGIDVDAFRISPLALGDLAHSAEARRRVRELAAGLQARGGRVIAPAGAGREAETYLRSCGVMLVDAASQSDRGKAFQPQAAVEAA